MAKIVKKLCSDHGPVTVFDDETRCPVKKTIWACNECGGEKGHLVEGCAGTFGAQFTDEACGQPLTSMSMIE